MIINMETKSKATVLTLDAGGTNFVFSAIRDFGEVTGPVRLDAVTDDINGCFDTLVEGFEAVRKQVGGKVDAISFAFPGPADYIHGVIGDLPNFPCFKGGTPMGAFLEEKFGVPVFINNDGNLFAYGEAIAGALPAINADLEAAGSTKRYRNLLGVTLGTGFGGGVVIDGELLRGDNGCGGDVWLMRNSLYPSKIAEESVSIRAIRRVYHELCPEDGRDLSPKDIFDIAEGALEGSASAAKASFDALGIVAGEAIIHALDIIDGLVVIGGGLSGASKYIVPAVVETMRGVRRTFSGAVFPRLQSEVFDLTDPADKEIFLLDESAEVEVPGSARKVRYEKTRKTGVTVSALGTGRAVSLGAYAYALSALR
jgi:glucokinase